MIRRFVKDDVPAGAESHAEFDDRVNAAMEEYRDAQLVAQFASVPGGVPTIYSQIGAEETVGVGPGQYAKMFKDLSRAEVAKRLDARKAALARGGPSILR